MNKEFKYIFPIATILLIFLNGANFGALYHLKPFSWEMWFNFIPSFSATLVIIFYYIYLYQKSKSTTSEERE